MVKRILLGTLCLLLAACLGAGLWNVRNQEREQAAAADAKEAEARPLLVEKYRLIQELNDLKDQLERNESGDGSVVIVFTQAREEVYTQAYPILEEYGYQAVLALSADEYPGQAECVSLSQYRELLQAGWSVCVRWDGIQPLTAYVKQIKEICRDLDTELPDTIYVDEGCYSEEEDELIYRLGFSNVIHHGESGRSLLTTDVEDDLWHPGAMPWNRSGIKTALKATADSGGNLVLSVDFSGGESQFTETAFPKLCAYLQGLEQTLFVTDIQSARDYREEVQARTTDTELEAEIARVQSQIEELEAQYRAIYDEE